MAEDLKCKACGIEADWYIWDLVADVKFGSCFQHLGEVVKPAPVLELSLTGKGKLYNEKKGLEVT